MSEMEPRTRALMFGSIALVVLAALIGSIIFLGKSSKNTSSNRSGALNNLPVISAPTPGVSSDNTSSGRKTFAGPGFSINYPTSWGLLTCNNTSNVEFDPAVSQDLKGIVCGEAVKPITVMVQSGYTCSGETVTIGGHKVIKSTGNLSSGGIQHNWCLTVGQKSLWITNRVSDKGNRATSSTDYSAQIEEMIKNISMAPQAS